MTLRLFRTAALTGCVFAMAGWGSIAAAQPAPVEHAALDERAACAALIPVPWPQSLIERRIHLRLLEQARPRCISHPGFLGALGALWLDDGDAEQARTWLERALMLDPDSPGLQADHALALSALGEPTALRELATTWRTRNDVPLALRARIADALDPGGSLRLPTARLGEPPARRRRAGRGDASVLFGHETNLGVSPRLTTLELTPPEGPISLPVISQPRRGTAVRADLGWQMAWELGPTHILRSAIGVAARAAPGASSTDWHQVTAAGRYTRLWGSWSASAQVDVLWFGGALTEPYGLARTRLSAEWAGESCEHLLEAEADQRRQSQTRLADSLATYATWRMQCRPSTDWLFSVQLRGGQDKPDHANRPGGLQRHASAVGRLAWRMTPLSTVDLSAGATRLRDSEGYSPLLDNNAVRWQRQQFVALEFSRGLDLSILPGAEGVLQFTASRQDSNLVLFRYRARTAYAGLRWPW